MLMVKISQLKNPFTYYVNGVRTSPERFMISLSVCKSKDYLLHYAVRRVNYLITLYYEIPDL